MVSRCSWPRPRHEIERVAGGEVGPGRWLPAHGGVERVARDHADPAGSRVQRERDRRGRPPVAAQRDAVVVGAEPVIVLFVLRGRAEYRPSGKITSVAVTPAASRCDGSSTGYSPRSTTPHRRGNRRVSSKICVARGSFASCARTSAGERVGAPTAAARAPRPARGWIISSRIEAGAVDRVEDRAGGGRVALPDVRVGAEQQLFLVGRVMRGGGVEQAARARVVLACSIPRPRAPQADNRASLSFGARARTSCASRRAASR